MKNKEQQTNGLLTKKDIDKAAWSYIFFAQATQNFERMMGLAFCHVMEPILKKIYKDNPEEYKKSLERHMQYYNTEPQLGALIPGITIAMEEAESKRRRRQRGTDRQHQECADGTICRNW